jgi:hypothetical protein
MTYRNVWMTFGMVPTFNVDLADARVDFAPSIHSFGWGHPGKVFRGSTGISTLPSYTAGDVVGCGLMWTTAFFTKNGAKVGEISVQDLPNEVCPAVTLYSRTKTTGVAISVNLGQRAFVFDVPGYRQVKKQCHF